MAENSGNGVRIPNILDKGLKSVWNIVSVTYWLFLSYSLGKNSAEALRSMPEFLEYLQDMRALMKKYKIILSEGIVVEVNKLFKLFLIFFMTLLAQNPF